MDAEILTRWRTQLASGLAALDVVADQAQQETLLDYLQLLEKWNQAYNLSAVRNPGQMVSRHLLDSLAILHLLRGPNVLDIGTGAGLPGIPLAILMPHANFVLLDSNGKKTRFVNQARMELGLANVEVVQARVEDYRPSRLFNCITSRAFASLDAMLRGSSHLLAEGGCALAMKARVLAEEVAALPAWARHQVVPLDVPGEPGERCVILIERV